MLTLASFVEAAPIKQPITPAVKAFTNQMALRYGKTPCIGDYNYVIDKGTFSARGFDIAYKQLLGVMNSYKSGGMYFESGKKGNSFWAFDTYQEKSSVGYAELRNGRIHRYACTVKP